MRKKALVLMAIVSLSFSFAMTEASDSPLDDDMPDRDCATGSPAENYVSATHHMWGYAIDQDEGIQISVSINVPEAQVGMAQHSFLPWKEDQYGRPGGPDCELAPYGSVFYDNGRTGEHLKAYIRPGQFVTDGVSTASLHYVGVNFEIHAVWTSGDPSPDFAVDPLLNSNICGSSPPPVSGNYVDTHAGSSFSGAQVRYVVRTGLFGVNEGTTFDGGSAGNFVYANECNGDLGEIDDPPLTERFCLDGWETFVFSPPLDSFVRSGTATISYRYECMNVTGTSSYDTGTVTRTYTGTCGLVVLNDTELGRRVIVGGTSMTGVRHVPGDPNNTRATGGALIPSNPGCYIERASGPVWVSSTHYTT